MLATIPDAINEYRYNAANEDPRLCPCGGGGWVLSDWDTWHTCPVHHNGQQHPEADYLGLGGPEMDPVDGRPAKPEHLTMADLHGYARYSTAWWSEAIRRYCSDDRFAWWCWTWGLDRQSIGLAEDRIVDWGTD